MFVIFKPSPIYVSSSRLTRLLSKMSTIDGGIERYENIIKSANDNRLYRGLKLQNGLRALIISDATTDMSAASLVVNVGAMNDYKNLPGITHFLEHMLFMGSKKYPEENDYDEFLSEHAGESNASTDEETTNFHFEVGANFLEPALDRFAQFFIEPLLARSAVNREVKAVDSEHEDCIQDDESRIYQLEKSLSKENHPFNNFFGGNRESLQTVPKIEKIDVQSKLLEFHSAWYSSNIMYLAVLGRESLDDLERMVVSLFKKVENKNVPEIIYREHPYGPEQLGRKVFVVPVEDVRTLKMSFPTPDLLDQYKSAPDDYVSHLLSHEGPGGLCSELRKRSLSNSLNSELSYIAAGFAFFEIEIDLTEEAMNRLDEIVSLVFQYINFLKTEGVREWIFEENRRLGEMAFLFKDKKSPMSYVTALTSKMNSYPMEDVLSCDYLYDRWEPSLVQQFLQLLSPDNMQILIVNKSFESIADRVERWYGTKYKIETISHELIEEWRTTTSSNKFELPLPNQFIPQKFELYPLNENEPKHPYIFHESSLSRFFFKQDDQFRLPKLYVRFELFSPISHQDPCNRNLTVMFVNVLTDMLKEYSYDAQLAYLDWDINISKSGFLVSLSGFNEKLPILLKNIVEKMTNFEVDERRFEILKEEYIRSLKNVEFVEPDGQAEFYLPYLTSERKWSHNEMLAFTKILLAGNLEKFVPNMFSHLYIQGLIYGNCDKHAAAEIVNIIETPFKSASGVLAQQLLPLRQVKLDDGSNYIYETFNSHHSSSCYYVYYQCNIESTLNNILIALFAQIVEESCFDTLRTKEQLGYVVSSGIYEQGGVHGFTVLVQSDKHPAYLNSRVGLFLKNVEKTLCNLSEKKFEAHKSALATLILEKPRKMKEVSSKYWSEISSRLYNFDRDDMEVKQLHLLKKKDILDFYKNFIKKSGKMRRKLAVHVISKITNPTIPSDISNKGNKIEDVCIFKHSSSLSPLPLPYIKIPPVGIKV